MRWGCDRAQFAAEPGTSADGDDFRQGFFGVGDVSPWFSLAVVGGGFVVVAAWALRLLVTGYKIRS